MEARLSYMGHALMENRPGLMVHVQLTRVSGVPSGWRPWR